MPKPTSIDELKSWLAENADTGKINGELVIEPRPARIEFRGGIINGDLYDLLILRAAAFGYSKSDLLQHSFVLFLELTQRTPTPLSKPTIVNGRSEYRGFLAGSLYEAVMEVKENLQFTNADLLTVAGTMFVNSPLVVKRYTDFTNALVRKHKCTVCEIEQAIYGAAKLRARQRRLALSTETGEFVTDMKVAD